MTVIEGKAQGRISGVVRSLMVDRGGGFIQGEDGRDYFVHIKSVAGGQALEDGQSVEFEGLPSPEGYRATNIVPGELPPPPGQASESPRHFVWTQDPQARGFDTIFTLGSG
ncbi:TPA: cold-shock protein [Pseudomonas aeruginosa]